MVRLFTTAVAVALLAGFAVADDQQPVTNARKDDKKEEQKLGGVWVKEIQDGGELKFDFTTKDALTITVGVGDNALIIKTKTTVEKDGTIKAKATKIEVKGEFPVTLEDNYECSFKLAVDGKKAKVSNFTANQHDEQGKQIVEGEYSKKEDK
jgi:phage baseplate assembly protein gpV